MVTVLISQEADSKVEHKYLKANLKLLLPKTAEGNAMFPLLTKVQSLPVGYVGMVTCVQVAVEGAPDV